MIAALVETDCAAEKNDHRLEEIKARRDRGAAAVEKEIRDVSRKERARGGHKWNQETEELKSHG